MDAQPFWSVIFFLGLLATVAIRLTPVRKLVFITDYQTGVRFVKGAFSEILGPGAYPYAKSREEITVVDMRPQPFVVERFFYQDGLQSPSVISLGAELVVYDPYAATTKIKDRYNDSIALVRDTMRVYLGKTVLDTSPAARKTAAGKIFAVVNAELSSIGMKVQNLEITELWSRTVPGLVGSGRGAN